jgi:hypothetical protein
MPAANCGGCPVPAPVSRSWTQPSADQRKEDVALPDVRGHVAHPQRDASGQAKATRTNRSGSREHAAVEVNQFRDPVAVK